MADDKPQMTDEEYAALVYADDDGSLVVDLSEVAELKFEAIPKGVYQAVVDQVDFIAESKTSGKPMLAMTFKVADGEFKGRKLLPLYLSFSAGALAGTKSNLMRLDSEIFNSPFKPEMIAATGDLLNRECRIKVNHEDYQGSQIAKVQYIMEPKAGGASAGGFFGGEAAA